MPPRHRRFAANREECVHARVVAGLTLGKASDTLGVSSTHLGYIESGRRQPSPGLLARMAALYSVPIESLFTVTVTEQDVA